jgi:hypothetical protein
MFAGMARDNMRLPGSDFGYSAIEWFAVEELSELLKLNKHHCQKIFWLGHALQSFLSARNRMRRFGEVSNEIRDLYDRGVSYLGKVVDDN